MLSRHLSRVAAACVTLLCLLAPAYAAANPEDELAGTIRLIFSKNFVADWRASKGCLEFDGRLCLRPCCRTAFRMGDASVARECCPWEAGICW